MHQAIYHLCNKFQMLFGENVPGKDLCSTFTTLPSRRMSTQSLICEASSFYPSVPRRQGSLAHLDKVSYNTSMEQLDVLKDARLPPPTRTTGQSSRRRRLSVASSQAAHAGSSSHQEYHVDRNSRCHSTLGHFRSELDLYGSRIRSSIAEGDPLNGMAASSVNTRQRVWSETGRSCDETTMTLPTFRSGPEFLVPGTRPPSTSRRIIHDEISIGGGGDLMDLSYTDSLMHECSIPSYEKFPNVSHKRQRTSRDQRGHNVYEDPSTLHDDYKRS